MSIRFGSYDCLYPNGLMSITDGDNIFGIRMITRCDATGKLFHAHFLPFDKLKIGPVGGNETYHVEWTAENRTASFTWARTGEKEVYMKLTVPDGLSVLAEMYIPREYRLNANWANFVIQNGQTVTGEMISPYAAPSLNACRLLLSRPADEMLGYNDRNGQLADFEKTGRLRDMKPHNIWGSMGLNWCMGLLLTSDTEFLYSVDTAEGFLALPDREEIAGSIAAAREAAEKLFSEWDNRRVRGYGVLDGAAEAVENLLRYNTMYREDTDRRFIMVDRPWVRGDDGWGCAFNWDTFLSAAASGWIDPELAKEAALFGFDLQLPDGKIPLLSHRGLGHTSEPPITAGRSQHIVQGLTLWQIYCITNDTEWLQEIYPRLKRSHAWWFTRRADGQPMRDGMDKGLLGFGYDAEKEVGVLGVRTLPYVAKAQYAYFETYDDSPQWTTGAYYKSTENMENVTEDDVEDIAKYNGRTHTANIYTLERCCLYACEAECLEKMARELGKEEDAAYYRAQYGDMAKRVQEFMWNEEDGCFYNVHFDGHHIKVQAPDFFMPVLAGIATPEQTERLMKILLDPKKFWGEYKIPSIARDDPNYIHQNYWRGQIWPPLVLWSYLALRRSGHKAEAWELAESSARMLGREWKENCFCPENYNADTGRCSGSPHYNWGSLMGIMAMNEFISFEPRRVIFGDTLAPDGNGVENVPIDGHLYSARRENGKIIVKKDGAEIYSGTEPFVMDRTQRA